MDEPTTEWAAGRSFRFTQELDEWLTQRAKVNLRSLNSEVAHILLKEKERESIEVA